LTDVDLVCIPQHTATDCNTLQHTATSSQHADCRVWTWYVSLQCTATLCNTLQHTLQHTVTHCNTLQITATHCKVLQHTKLRCNTLQHTTAHSSTLHYTATHYTTLQHTATHCNTRQHAAHISIILIDGRRPGMSSIHMFVYLLFSMYI